MLSDDRAATPSQIARKYGVGVHKVLHWIGTGELRAINVATNVVGRPRWVVTADALADFERRRSAQPKPAPRRHPRKKIDVIEFF